MAIKLGNERLFDNHFELISGRRVGLITNPTGVDSNLNSTADRLRETTGIKLVALFGPEHGIRGDVEDGVHVADGTDIRTGVPMISLYGATNEMRADMLDGIDIVLFDIQDVGARFYTYLYTMSGAMAACAERGLPFVVLDRPNPIGGDILEGNLLDPAFSSFVGRYPLPIRYAMTIGEIAMLFNDIHNIDVELYVIEMVGWKRSMSWSDTALAWVPPSPNMPTALTAAVYPGMCFFEGTNISEGRGTTKPFEQIGAPFIDAFALADKMNNLSIPGFRWRPSFFTPSFGKHSGKRCGGVQLHATTTTLRPVTAAFHLLSTLKSMYSDQFEWHVPTKGIHNYDFLAGDDSVRKALDAGIAIFDLLNDWAQQRQPFVEIRKTFLRYQ